MLIEKKESSDNKTFIVTTKKDLNYNKDYSIKVTTDVKDLAGISLSSEASGLFQLQLYFQFLSAQMKKETWNWIRRIESTGTLYQEYNIQLI